MKQHPIMLQIQLEKKDKVDNSKFNMLDVT